MTDFESTLEAKRPVFTAWLIFSGLKVALVLLGGSAPLWSWVLFAAVAGVLWIEEPRWRRIDPRRSR